MKILVVDDERSFGSLLARALKRLGHRACVMVHPVDALGAFREQTFDAVITDIDMPVMNGVDLARALREHNARIPIAFCTGSSPTDDAVTEAATIGRVLPKIWTVADVKEIVRVLRAPVKIARGSRPALAVHATDADDTLEDNPPRKRHVLRKIKVSCRTWEQVEKLCNEQSEGRNHLTIRGPHQLAEGQRLTVALRLPDELVLAIRAEVVGVRPVTSGDGKVFSILLEGLTPEVCTRLRSMCVDAGSKASGSGRYSKVERKASEDTEPEPSDKRGKVLGNLRLRRQIDTLTEKLKN